MGHLRWSSLVDGGKSSEQWNAICKYSCTRGRPKMGCAGYCIRGCLAALCTLASIRWDISRIFQGIRTRQVLFLSLAPRIADGG